MPLEEEPLDGGKTSWPPEMEYTRSTSISRFVAMVASASALMLNVGPILKIFPKSKPGRPVVNSVMSPVERVP